MVERTCPTCNGTGSVIKDPCNVCNGAGRVKKSKSLSVKIPQGVEEGTRIRLAGEGEAGMQGGSAGDLYIFVSIKRHAFFERDREDLHCEVPLKMTTAALGGEMIVPSIDGSKAKLKIPAGTQQGSTFRLKNKGMSRVNSNIKGDLYVHVKIEVPVNLNKRQKEILQELDDTCNDKCNPKSKTFFDDVKKFFSNLGG
jgi:molecular chaperone DnaJ